MADIFISFIHEEEAFAKEVQEFLTTVIPSITPFMASDRFQMYAGEIWLDRILQELKGARVLLLMLSDVSVERPWVNFEAGAAWLNGSKVIPVCFGKLKKDSLPKPYSSLQALDLLDSGDQEYLARSVAHHIGVEEPAFPTALDYLGLSHLAGEAYQLKIKRGELGLNSLQKGLQLLLRAETETESAET
ncbi:MAG TPA: toll/interleukin-1 receptor domain-containing protein [Terriglobales bacterium]|nr:toll/interleukin-1 receptor domain-containing protein [Terriglobales bacterium]